MIALDQARAAIAPYLLLIKIGIALILLLAAFIGGCQVNAGRLADEEAAHKADNKAHAALVGELENRADAAKREAAAATAKAVSGRESADKQYRAMTDEANRAKRNLAAALRRGTIRLQDRWACPMPGAAKSGAASLAGGHDEAAKLRREREEAISEDIEEHDAADAQVTWLQTELISTIKACGVRVK